MKKSPTTIDEYLSNVRNDHRAALEKLRRTIKRAAPKAAECISYGLAAFRLDGQVLVGIGASARHCAFYPMTGHTVAEFKSDLTDFQTSKGAIRFQPAKPLPVALIRKIVKARLAEIHPKQVRAKKYGTNKQIHRHKDGSVWATGQVLNGRQTGYWEWFRKDGTRMRSGYFEKGKQVGAWTTYRQNGDVVKITTMKGKTR